ncbi:UNVERIFIED_CONTAM: hypothetical protein FKN15_008964 [Acipenser sinensis]
MIHKHKEYDREKGQCAFQQLINTFASEIGELKQEMVQTGLAADRDPETPDMQSSSLEEDVSSLYLQEKDTKSSARDSGYDSLKRKLSILDRLILAHPVWLQLTLSDDEAHRILQQQQPGIFLVRKSAKLQKKVISLRLGTEFGPSIRDFPIKESQYTFSLEGSGISFADLFRLIAFYCISRQMFQREVFVSVFRLNTKPKGGYYLTSAYGAMSLIKNFQEEQAARLLSSETRNTLHQWHRRRTTNRTIPTVDDFQNYLRVAFQEVNSGCTAKTLVVKPYATTEELCEVCADKFKVQDPSTYALFLVTEETSQQLAPDTYPQKIKAEIHSRPQPLPFHFVYKRPTNLQICIPPDEENGNTFL